MSKLSVYKIHLCKKTPPIPLLPFLYHFKVFSELRTERQNGKIVVIAKAQNNKINFDPENIYGKIKP